MSDKKEEPAATALTVSNPHVLVARMVEKGVDADALKKMLDIAERWQQLQAQAAFNSGLATCQKEIGRVVKNANANGKLYANLEAVNDAIKPTYTAQGFAVTFTEDTCPTLGCARVVATLRHQDGHSEKYYTDIPIDDGKGPKGGQAQMTLTQGKGSTLAYARRYLLHLIFNLTIANEDNDGNGGKVPINEDQIKVINELIADCANEGRPVDFPKFLVFALGEGVQGTLGDVPQSEFSRLVDFLTARVRNIRKKKAEVPAKGDAAE